MGVLIRFKRQELLSFLAKERVFGDALALTVDMEFLKEPRANPDTVLQCYLTALEKLDYRVENLHQPPAQAALNADPNFMMIVDDGYWIRRNVKTRLNHCFKRYKTDLTLTQADILAPTAPRFGVIISNLLNIHFSRLHVYERFNEVDESIELKRAENRAKSEQLSILRNKVEAMRPTYEKTLIEIEKIKVKIERTQTDMTEAVNQVNKENAIMSEKSLVKERLERQSSNIEAEINLLTNEKNRLQELVVTDPDEWERAFKSRQKDIQNGKDEILNLKNVLIPNRETDVQKAQQFTKDITAVTEQMVELERLHGRHENILADLSNVQCNTNQLNKNITGLKRDADFKQKSNQLQITKLKNQEDTLYDEKNRQADQNAEYFDIKKGLTRNLKRIQQEHEELKFTMNYFEQETPHMQIAHDQHTVELAELNDSFISLHRKVHENLVHILPQ